MLERRMWPRTERRLGVHARPSRDAFHLAPLDTRKTGLYDLHLQRRQTSQHGAAGSTPQPARRIRVGIILIYKIRLDL
jgi:hypothetical protein